MEFVKPITSKAKIDEMKELMWQDGKDRERTLFILGINSGLRISDLLTLKWKDLDGSAVKIKEQKTGKTKRFVLNVSCLEALAAIPQGEPEEYIFETHSTNKRGNPWTRQYVWQFMNRYAHMVGLEEIGTHTLRKTFGFFVYQKTKDITIVQKLLNHSSPQISLRYIGLEQRDLDAVYAGLNL